MQNNRKFIFAMKPVLILALVTALLLIGSAISLASEAKTEEDLPEASPQKVINEENEFRAIWVARFALPTNGTITPETIKAVIKNAVDYNFNVVILQVRGQSDVWFPSKYEPWARELGMKDPGFDPLALAVEEAHKNGIQLYTWLNTYQGWTGNTPPVDKSHVYHHHPEWLQVDENGKRMELNDSYVFLSPGIPEVQNKVFNVFMEVVRNYDVDGINFDYVRYPTPNYSYDPVSLTRFTAQTGIEKPSDDPEAWNEWRRTQVTDLVERIYKEATMTKPELVVTADVWGDWSDGFNGYFQDCHGWMARGILDVAMPMNYTIDLDLFTKRANMHFNNTHGRAVAMGNGPYMIRAFNGELEGDDKRYLRDVETFHNQIKFTRENPNSYGIVVYDYGALFPNHHANTLAIDLRDGLFAKKASVPKLPWKGLKDDDIVGPMVTDVKTIPAKPRDGDDVYISCKITDPSGIYDDITGLNGQGVFLLWEENSDISKGDSDLGNEVLMYKKEGEQHTYISSDPISGLKGGSVLTLRVWAHDNDFDDENPADRNQGYSELISIPIGYKGGLYVVKEEIGPAVRGMQFATMDTEGRIWVCEYSGKQFRVFNQDGSEASFSPVNKGLNADDKMVDCGSPAGLAVNSEGVVFAVSGITDGTIFRFDAKTGKPLTGWKLGYRSGDIDIDSMGNIYVVELLKAKWHVYDKTFKEYKGSPFSRDIAGTHINRGIAVTDDGTRVYIADELDKAVYEWTGIFEGYLARYNMKGVYTRAAEKVGAVDVDAMDNVYVSDFMADSVKVFNKFGNIIDDIACEDPKLAFPRGVAHNADASELYIVSTGNFLAPARIQKWVIKEK